jgi:hypothetical protein
MHSIQALRTMASDELQRLSGELDLFSSPAPTGPELLQWDLYPPLPFSDAGLIWGFHILRAALAAGKHELTCRFLPDLSAPEMLRLALNLEARPGGYSWPEKEACLAFLRRHGQETSLQELSHLLTGKADPRLGERIQAYSALAPSLKTLVAGGLLDLKSALRVKSLPDSVFRTLSGAAGNLTFSGRRLLLGQLEEVRRRERLEEPALLSLLSEALAAEDPPALIRRRRYPLLTGLEERFRNLQQETLGKSGVRLQAPAYFEGEAFTVSFSFRSRASLAGKLARLRALEDRSDELFSLLR